MTGPIVGEDGIARCPWAVGDPLMTAYHDSEWGLPAASESALFERLTLEAFQSGLSWRTILVKRPAFRLAFHDFDIDRIATYDDVDRARLMADAGIVRNRLKVDATITNAGACIDLRRRGGLEVLVERSRPEVASEPTTTEELETKTPESAALSKALKKEGLVFVGPTTMYALMGALGIADQHLVGCHRRGCAQS